MLLILVIFKPAQPSSSRRSLIWWLVKVIQLCETSHSRLKGILSCFMIRAPGGNTFQTFRGKAYFSAYMSMYWSCSSAWWLGIKTLHHEFKYFKTAWRGSPESFPTTRTTLSQKKHTHTTQLLLELINVRNYHTVVWRFLL